MDDCPGFDDASFNEVSTRPQIQDLFSTFWAEHEPIDPALSSPTVTRHDGTQQVPVAGLVVADRLESAESQASQCSESDAIMLSDGIRYSVEWKAVLKTKRIGMDTEQDVSLAPGMFWETTLHKKVEDLLNRKYSAPGWLDP